MASSWRPINAIRQESFTIGSFVVAQINSSQKPLVAFGNVPFAADQCTKQRTLRRAPPTARLRVWELADGAPSRPRQHSSGSDDGFYQPSPVSGKCGDTAAKSNGKQAEAAHSQRANEITRLEVELETKGALGQEETAAEKQRELEHVERRYAELGHRAKALDHLLKLLREKRSALAQRLRAPLQKHLNHYLQILFPGAQIEVGDDLSPGRITRLGIRGTESGEFEELSVGAREQMGVVARLAYADLLKEAGKPTLLILDDALVHTDEERLGQMKRVLYDAAARHQILIFSCHPEAWRDLGVITRSIS